MKILLISLLFLIGCKKSIDIIETPKQAGIAGGTGGGILMGDGKLYLYRTADYGQSWAEDSIIQGMGEVTNPILFKYVDSIKQLNKN